MKGQPTLTWISEEALDKLRADNGDIQLCEVESLVEKDAKGKPKLFEYIVKPPDDTAYSASMRYITNTKENTNDVMKMQQVMFNLCYVTGEPGLQKELEVEGLKARHQFAIGKVIGDAYPLPEARLKKSLKKGS